MIDVRRYHGRYEAEVDGCEPFVRIEHGLWVQDHHPGWSPDRSCLGEADVLEAEIQVAEILAADIWHGRGPTHMLHVELDASRMVASAAPMEPRPIELD